MNEKEQKLRELIVDNSDLPVIFMVNSDVVVDDFYANWLASIRSVEIGEYCCYKTRYYYNDKNDLEEDYYVDHEDELKYLKDNEIDMIIKERTSSWWEKAIIVYVDVPSDEEANDHE